MDESERLLKLINDKKLGYVIENKPNLTFDRISTAFDQLANFFNERTF